MYTLELKKPTAAYADAIAEFKQELLETGCDFAGCGSLRGCGSAEEWIELVEQSEVVCPAGGVTSNSYIAVRRSDDRLVGIIDYRHSIDHPILGVWGGHIGYTVRPSERRKGYAREMLRLNLQNCRGRGLDRALLVCKSDNTASEKVIVANGGVFEKEITVDGTLMKRYWIDLQSD